MSQWDEQFNNHQIRTTASSLDTKLDEISGDDSADANLLESVERLRQSKQFAMSALDTADPNLVSEQKLNTINNILEEQIGQLNNFKTNGNVAHITNAVRSIDTLLTHTTSLPIIRTSQDAEGVREAIASLRRSIGQYARNVEAEGEKIDAQFNDTKKRFEEFTGEITSQKQRLDTAISQFQQQFSEAESKRRDEYSTEAANTRAELNKVVAAGKEEIDNLASTLREEFDAAESQRKSEYDAQFSNTKTSLGEVLDKGKKDLSNLTQQHKETFSNLVSETKESRKTMDDDFATKVVGYLEQLEQRKTEAETLVQVIGNTGMVGGYQKLANQERLSAWIWHGITFVFMAGLVTFAIIAFYSTTQPDFRWGIFGARAFVAVAFGLGVAWAAREADKHHDVERRSRKMELELASISPYLALLPDDAQFTVKTELAKRFFGQTDPVADIKPDKQVTGSLLDLLKMALEMAAKK